MLDPELETHLKRLLVEDMDDVVGTRRAIAVQTGTDIAQRVEPPKRLRWRDLVAMSQEGDVGVPVRIYERSDTTDLRGALIYFHGGAFVFGDLESEHTRCLRYADESGCV